MGVKGLWSLLDPYSRPVALETLYGKTLAIDASIWIYQFTKAMKNDQGETPKGAHIIGFFRRICKLCFHGIKPVFVYDGKAPALKDATLTRRKNKRSQIQTNLKHTAKKLLDNKIMLSLIGEKVEIKTKRDSDDIDISSLTKEFKFQENDEHFISDSQLRKFIDEHLDSSQLEIDSSFFNTLPIEIQHEIILDQKQESRKTSWKRLSEMIKSAPTAMDFSKLQINNLIHRNQMTEKVSDFKTSANLVSNPNASKRKIKPIRIASQKNREFVLIKNEDDRISGWKMQLNSIKPNTINNNDKIKDNNKINNNLIQINENNHINTKANDSQDKDLPHLSKQQDSPLFDQDLMDVFQAFDHISSNPINTVKKTPGQGNLINPTTDLIDSKHKYDVLSIEEDLESQNSSPQNNVSNIKIPLASIETISSDEDEEFIDVDDVGLDLRNVNGNEMIQSTDNYINNLPLSSNQPSLESTNSLPIQLTTIEIKNHLLSCDEADIEIMLGDLIEQEPNRIDEFLEMAHEVIIHKRNPTATYVSYVEVSEKMQKIELIEKAEPMENIQPIEKMEPMEKIELIENIPSMDLDYESESDHLDIPHLDIEQESSSFTAFMSDLTNKDTTNQDNASWRQDLINDTIQLEQQKQKETRLANDITLEMARETQELLKLFGIPFIVAESEAESQCAFLQSNGLVDGIVTEDSDVFLFGGDKVYRNLFNQTKFVGLYQSSDFEKVGLNRETFINLAFLLGSDYTDGITGIGLVNAMEILKEWSGNNGLISFKLWVNEVCENESFQASPSQKKFINIAKKIEFPNSFLDERVIQEYLNPAVDKSTVPFSWGQIDLLGVRDYLNLKLSWRQEKVDEIVLPVIKEIQKRATQGVQTRLDQFFDKKHNEPTVHKNKRIKTVLDAWTNDHKKKEAKKNRK